MPTDQKVNILLVDDRPENLVALESVLSGLGQNLVRAHSGREALRRLLDRDYAVILLDVQMPEMDGFETATLIRARERSRHTPIVFLTAINKSETHVTRGYSVGAADYVFKPFEPDILRAKVSAFVDLARKTDELEREIQRRQEAENAVRQLNEDLERRVRERTAELLSANRKLEREVVERRRAEKERTRLFNELAEAGRRKDEFLAMLAHELRNPLAAISNAHYLLQEVAPGDPRGQRLQDIIGRQTRHLARLVDDLLDISRVTRGKVELRMEAVEMADIAGRALEANRAFIESRGLTLTATLPDEPAWVHADATRLEQIVSNLLNNAAKYTEPGGHVEMIVERDGGSVVTRVRDTGMGLSEELLTSVFDLFTQADRTLDRSEGGLGIGLALVRRLVEMHGGTVEAHSDGVGKGSEFSVRLPLLANASDLEEDASEAARETAAESVRPGLPDAGSATLSGGPRPCCHVLILDDNLDAVEALADLLTFWGHDVCVVQDGPTAIEMARNSHFDLALIDIGLPGMNGYEVAHAFRQDLGLKDIMMVAVTGYGQEEDRRRSEQAGCDMHLTKPVNADQLRRLLAERACHGRS